MTTISLALLDNVTGGQQVDQFAANLDKQFKAYDACVTKVVKDQKLTDPAQIQAAADKNCMLELVGPMRRAPTGF